MLLQEVLQQWVRGLGGGRGKLKLRCRRRDTPDALPPDAATETPEGHRQGVEVPKDGPEGPQEVDVEDEVEAQIGRAHV